MNADARPARGAWLVAQLWIWLVAWLSATGWLLSAVHQLNLAGYSASLLLGAFFLWRWNRRTHAAAALLESLQRFARRRRRRPLEWIFLGLLALAFLGGAIYPPSSYDTLTYRLPQALHWLDHGSWHWVQTVDDRINFAPPGQAWLFVPMLLFTRTLRLLFLTNVLSLALFPGLLFTYLSACGVRPRIAAGWMFLGACAFGYVLQAGSVANDLLGATYALAGVTFALRARTSQRVADLWTAALAMTLATAVKTTNLPLLLPLAVAAWPALHLLRGRLLATLGIAAVAALISFLPTAVLNDHFTGDWSGDPTNSARMKMRSPYHAFVGNMVVIGTQILDPPVNPIFPQWVRFLRALEQAPFVEDARRFFPRLWFYPHEMPIEENASLGLGVGGLLLLAAVLRLRERTRRARFGHGAVVVWAGWGAFLFFMMTVGSEGSQRHLISYYALLFPTFLGMGNAGDFERRGWRRWAGALGALMVLLPLVVSAARPLLPIAWFAREMKARHPESPLWQRADTVFKTYATRGDLLGPLREQIPADEPLIGCVAVEDIPETALWQPLGFRRVIRFVRQPSPGEQVRREGLRWVVVSEPSVRELFNITLEEFLAQVGGEVVFSKNLIITVAHAPHDFYVIKIKPPAEAP